MSPRDPILYHQQRVGLNGAPFTIHKFRTMRSDAEARTGPVWSAGENDPRITRVGRFLRETRLDEIPQLWNVLRGDMSLIGPRPERPAFVEQLTEQIPFYGQRHVVKPGVTGWAQVRYSYGASVEEVLAICRERNVAVQIIKAIARGPWATADRTHTTWYQPLEAQGDIDRAVHWVLGLPGVFLSTVGDLTLLPRVLDAAHRFERRPGDDEMAALVASTRTTSLFGLPT